MVDGQEKELKEVVGKLLKGCSRRIKSRVLDEVKATGINAHVAAA